MGIIIESKINVYPYVTVFLLKIKKNKSKKAEEKGGTLWQVIGKPKFRKWVVSFLVW